MGREIKEGVFNAWEKIKKELEKIYSAPILLFSIREAYAEDKGRVYYFKVVIAEPDEEGRYKLVTKIIRYDPITNRIIYMGENR